MGLSASLWTQGGGARGRVCLRRRVSDGSWSPPRALGYGPAGPREFFRWGLEEDPLPFLGSCDAKCQPESTGEGARGFMWLIRK